MPKSFIGPAVLATGLVIVSCAFAQEVYGKTCPVGTASQVSASDTSHLTLSRSVAAATPVAPISISIGSPAAAVVNVTAATISVSGTAVGGAGITEVTWTTSDGATGVASGAGTWVATGIPVIRGTTTIILRAYDSNGASNWLAFVAVKP